MYEKHIRWTPFYNVLTALTRRNGWPLKEIGAEYFENLNELIHRLDPHLLQNSEYECPVSGKTERAKA